MALKLGIIQTYQILKNDDEVCIPSLSSILLAVQGVQGQSGFFNLALRERNIQVRLYLKVVLKSWDVDILIIRTNLKKSNLGWPQHPPTEKVHKLKNDISWFH